MRTLQEIWPLFGLHIRSGPVELAAIRDDDIPVLVELAESGIHDPDAMPFAFPWTDVPKDELGRNMAVHYWQCRGSFARDRWSLELVVSCCGQRASSARGTPSMSRVFRLCVGFLAWMSDL